MELTDQELSSLEAYYMGSLPPAERLALEQRMQKEKDYGAAAHDFLRGMEALEMGKIKTHRLYMQATTPSVRVSFVRRWWWAAAAIVGVVLGTVWWKTNNQGTQSLETALADAYFKPYLSSMGQAGATDTRTRGTIEYENENYREAIPFLQREWETDNIPYTKFLLGNAYFATGQADLALSAFLEVEGKTGVPLENEWYIALAYLKTGNIKKCTELLEKIQRSNSTKSKQAQSLIQRLNKK